MSNSENWKNWIESGRCLLDEPMAKHTTFRVGGPARVYCTVDTEESLVRLLQELAATGQDYFALGNGSNLLVSDRGYDGVIVHLGKGMDRIYVEGNRLIAGAGAQMAAVAQAALEHGLTGLEFASGIPGTLGGGVIMNAGAYGGELCQVVTRVKAVDAQGTLLTYSGKEMDFGYRHSRLKGTGSIVTEVTMELTPGDAGQIRATMEEMNGKRREKQPLNYPSAGSTFKRPEGYFAGKLIQDAGLAGYRVGGASVSTKHCGFVVNDGNGTATDIYRLIQEITAKVRENSGVTLEPEVILLGDFS